MVRYRSERGGEYEKKSVFVSWELRSVHSMTQDPASCRFVFVATSYCELTNHSTTLCKAMCHKDRLEFYFCVASNQ